MMTAKLELNIRGLITHCEEIVSTDTKDWSLKKYIKSLNTMIDELDEQTDKPSEQIIAEYRNRCDNLKQLTNYTVAPVEQKLRSRTKESTTGDSVIKEIHQINDAKYNQELRKDLLGSVDNVRKRNTQAGNEDMAAKYYSDLQEKIAEDMLQLTSNLKEQTKTANKIIKKDTEIVEKSTKLSDKNMLKLKDESDKLDEHSKRAWKCWMWIMIGMVMMIFLFMVLFIKFIKKPPNA